MTEAENYRRWLMRRTWFGPGYYGWAPPKINSKKDDYVAAIRARHRYPNAFHTAGEMR